MTRRVIGIALALVLGVVATAPAQNLTYAKGQNVSPAYEGWEEDSAGRKFFVFGYMNRNWQEELDVPVGPDNRFTTGTADQGQPTHFLPRRNRFIFRVPVPPGFTEKDEMVWSLTTQGKTEQAFASLRLDYKIDDVVRASETGALGAGSSSPEVRANTPPVLEVQGPRRVEVRVGQPVPLAVTVSDDGIPKARAIGAGAAVENEGSATRLSAANVAQVEVLRARRLMQPPSRVTVGKNVGLHVGWFVYRGAGHGEVRAGSDRVVGRHAHRRQLALGPALGRAAAAARRQALDHGLVLHARRIRAAVARRRWRAHDRPAGYRRREALTRVPRSALDRAAFDAYNRLFLPCS